MKKHEKKSTVFYIEQQNCPNNHFKNSLENNRVSLYYKGRDKIIPTFILSKISKNPQENVYSECPSHHFELRLKYFSSVITSKKN